MKCMERMIENIFEYFKFSDRFYFSILFLFGDIDMVLKVDNASDIRIPLIEADSLLSNPMFKKELPLVIFLQGLLGGQKTPIYQMVDKLYEAYKSRGGYNFVVRT